MKLHKKLQSENVVTKFNWNTSLLYRLHFDFPVHNIERSEREIQQSKSSWIRHSVAQRAQHSPQHTVQFRSLIRIYSLCLFAHQFQPLAACFYGNRFIIHFYLHRAQCTLHKMNDEWRRKCGALIIYELSHSWTFYNATEACSTQQMLIFFCLLCNDFDTTWFDRIFESVMP